MESPLKADHSCRSTKRKRPSSQTDLGVQSGLQFDMNEPSSMARGKQKVREFLLLAKLLLIPSSGNWNLLGLLSRSGIETNIAQYPSKRLDGSRLAWPLSLLMGILCHGLCPKDPTGRWASLAARFEWLATASERTIGSYLQLSDTITLGSPTDHSRYASGSDSAHSGN